MNCCPECGEKLKKSVKSCSKCGYDLSPNGAGPDSVDSEDVQGQPPAGEPQQSPVSEQEETATPGSEPEETVTPGSEPEETVTPDISGESEPPDESAEHAESDEPDEPEVLDESDETADPAESDDSDEPAESDDPGESEAPDEPAMPHIPTIIAIKAFFTTHKALVVGIGAGVLIIVLAVLLLNPFSQRPSPGNEADELRDRETQTTPDSLKSPEPEPTPPPTPTPPQELTPEPTATPPPQEPTPEPTASPPPQSLAEAVLNTNDWVRITMHWPDWSGTAPTVFERDKNSPVWTQASRDGYTRIVDADFTESGGTVYIGIPNTDSKFIMEEDGTGSLFSERLTWTYETNADVPQGGSYGIDLTHDLQDALSRNTLIVIRVYWSNGEFAYFYRNNKGGWQMGQRSGIRTISPSFDFLQNSAQMSFSASSSRHNYSLPDGGTGTAGNENITWNYSYFDK